MQLHGEIVPTLSEREWHAVSDALIDAAACGCRGIGTPTVVGRVLRTVFPTPPVEALADPRREALRRFVCETRRAGRKSDAHEPLLATYGFNTQQIAALALLSA